MTILVPGPFVILVLCAFLSVPLDVRAGFPVSHEQLKRPFYPPTKTPAGTDFSAGITDDWKIISNGQNGVLRIEDLDKSGRFQGDLFNGTIYGLFENLTGKISFIRATGLHNSTFQLYTGYISDISKTRIGDQLVTDVTLAGTYKDFDINDIQSFGNEHGWYATSQTNCAPC
jgi:hypothetical protein